MAQTKSATRTKTTSGNHHMFPPKPELATPSDLSAEQVKAVTEAINPIIADTIALYIKTQNYHWHLSGIHFRDLHLLFDEHAAELIGALDPLAERVRKIGGNTIRSVGMVQDLMTLQDDDEEFVPAEQMVRRLLDDNRRVVASLRKAIEICEKNNDSGTTNLLEDLLDAAEKRVWFLFETVQGTDAAR